MAPLLKTILLSMALIANCNAHMVMRFPPPIGNPSNSPCNNKRNPSANSGGEFPCKVSNPADYQNAQITTLQAGGKLDVAFLGSAVHGGGSCQFSLTKSLAPDSSTPFKVIHSVEGGCPARNEAGNILPADPSFQNPSTYSVPIPPQLAAGRYTFSWSWINKVGNREYYMNCAAIQIGSSSGASGNGTTSSDSFFDSLPDMVILNTNSDDCTNPEGEGSYRFANPGASVERNEDMSKVRLILPQCVPGGRKITSSNGNPGSGAGIAPTTTGFATKTARPTSKPTGAFASGDTNNPSANDTGDVDTDPNPTPDTTTPNNPSSSCPATHAPCTAVGFSCLTPSTFTKCAQLNDCALIEMMATGTKCENNAVVAADPIVRRRIHARRSSRHRWHGRAWASGVHVH